jgi:hypothetical protein
MAMSQIPRRTKSRRVMAALGLGAAGVAATLIILAVAAGGAQASPPGFAALPAAAHDQAGVRLSAHNLAVNPMAARVSTDRAVQVARARVGAARAVQASAVSVTFGDFSDDMYVTTLADGRSAYVAQNRPAYIVTYQGVTVPHRGPGPSSNHELNVVVDAATGKIIEVFSYR